MLVYQRVTIQVGITFSNHLLRRNLFWDIFGVFVLLNLTPVALGQPPGQEKMQQDREDHRWQQEKTRKRAALSYRKIKIRELSLSIILVVSWPGSL